MNTVFFNLRIPEELNEQISQIAKNEGRSKNKQIEQILKEYVNNYNKRNEQISISQNNNKKAIVKF
ncbi:MAG: Arc family DNA-binding protein [Oscillospiraceae bacterium]